jgi:hypothetical protein
VNRRWSDVALLRVYYQTYKYLADYAGAAAENWKTQSWEIVREPGYEPEDALWEKSNEQDWLAATFIVRAPMSVQCGHGSRLSGRPKAAPVFQATKASPVISAYHRS